MSNRKLRTLASAVVLAGGALLGTATKAFACDPSNGGCCTCVIHFHDNGDRHTTCCCWAESGKWTGCGNEIT